MVRGMGVDTLVWPVDVDPLTGNLRVAEQGSDADVGSCVKSVLATPKGWRIDDPKFGRPQTEWQQGGVDEAALANAVLAYEQRATPDVIAQAIADDFSQRVTIDPGPQT